MRAERGEEQESARGVGRRVFLSALAAGAGFLAIGAAVRGRQEQRRVPGPADIEGSFRANAFVTLAPDGRVLFALNKCEMGQGIMTGYAMLVAEELRCALEKVESYFADGAPEYRTSNRLQLTGGSTSMREGYSLVRNAAAAARTMLVAAAAEQWEVEADSCTAEHSFVRHADSGREASYTSLLAAAAEQSVPEQPVLLSDTQATLLGSSPKRLDARAKVDGSAVYGMDVKLPNMLRALVLHPPRFGAAPLQVEAKRARAMPGVEDVVTFHAGVAILAEKYWQALRARPHVEIEWGEGHRIDTAALRGELRANESPAAQVVHEQGTVDAALAGAATRLDASYELPYLAHAPMEPNNCLAHVHEDWAELWAPTQAPIEVQEAVAQLLGFERNDIVVHSTFLGGGFGRRGIPDAALEAAALSQLSGRPVQVTWSRESDIRQGYYRPLAQISLSGGLDEAGQLLALDFHSQAQPILADQEQLFAALFPDLLPPGLRARAARRATAMTEAGLLGPDPFATEGARELPYALPNLRVGTTPYATPIPVAFWRSVGHSINAFAVESFFDELAHAGAHDPYTLRMELLAQTGEAGRARAVLEAVAKLGQWDAPAQPGFAKGIAVHASFGSVCAQVVEAGVVEERIVVRRIAAVMECGRVINPELVRAQVEGAIVFGLSAALHQQITVEDGAVAQGNFDSYPLVRMHECPEIVVEVLELDTPPEGVGEVGLPPVAPALANALFAATGVRLRSLPLQPAWDTAREERGS